jgi:hypothetical protein
MSHTPPPKVQPAFDQLPDDAFMRQKPLLRSGLAPFSASTLRRKWLKKEFPSPIKISQGITAFRVGDIRKWLADPAGYALASGKQGVSK